MHQLSELTSLHAEVVVVFCTTRFLHFCCSARLMKASPAVLLKITKLIHWLLAPVRLWRARLTHRDISPILLLLLRTQAHAMMVSVLCSQVMPRWIGSSVGHTLPAATRFFAAAAACAAPTHHKDPRLSHLSQDALVHHLLKEGLLTERAAR